VEIEPDGQQFLNARAAEQDGSGDGPDQPRPPAPPPPSGGSRMTIFVVVAVLVVLAAGGVAFATLTGDDSGPRELETGGDSEIDIRDRAESTTTTERPRETTTTAVPTTTTAPPSDSVVPFPDFGQVQPGVQPGVAPPPPTCPSGGISMVIGRSSSTTTGAGQQVDIDGTATNSTNAPVMLDLTLTVDHDAVNHPKPWVTPVRQARPTLGPGESTTWTFSATFAQATYANVSALGGGFRWADPAHASCPTQ
jgi:hypothetical protein